MGVEDLIPAADIVGDAFQSVFRGIDAAVEVRFQAAKLFSTGRSNFVRLIRDQVGLFPLFGTGRTTSVTSAFVKVDVCSELEREKYRSLPEIVTQVRGNSARTAGGVDPLQALEQSAGRLVLLGLAGSGKTTIFRHLAVHAASGAPILGRPRLPVYIALREQTDSETSVYQSITEFLRRLGVEPPSEVAEYLLHSGRCMLLIDGLDEVPLSHQRRVVLELDKLRVDFPDAVWCLSARPRSLSAGLASFRRWETLPLSWDSRLLFVEKWFADVSPEKGRLLVSACRDRRELLDLGSTPLLLSIVCALFHNDLDIPREPHELYGRAIEGLLGGWDAFRSIARETPLRPFSLVKRVVLVSHLAAALQCEGKVVFRASEVARLGCLDEAAKAMRTRVPSTEEILESLYNDFGLLSERSPGVYSFTHLTFQEFLTAKHCADSRRETEIIVPRWREGDWAQVLRLVVRMLPDASRLLLALHESADVRSEADLALLRDVWGTGPICDAKTAQEIALQLSRQLEAALLAVGDEFSVDEGIIHVRTSVVSRIGISAQGPGGPHRFVAGDPRKDPSQVRYAPTRAPTISQFDALAQLELERVVREKRAELGGAALNHKQMRQLKAAFEIDYLQQSLLRSAPDALAIICELRGSLASAPVRARGPLANLLLAASPPPVCVSFD